jgi:hypothetical protein
VVETAESVPGRHRTTARSAPRLSGSDMAGTGRPVVGLRLTPRHRLRHSALQLGLYMFVVAEADQLLLFIRLTSVSKSPLIRLARTTSHSTTPFPRSSPSVAPTALSPAPSPDLTPAPPPLADANEPAEMDWAPSNPTFAQRHVDDAVFRQRTSFAPTDQQETGLESLFDQGLSMHEVQDELRAKEGGRRRSRWRLR